MKYNKTKAATRKRKQEKTHNTSSIGPCHSPGDMLGRYFFSWYTYHTQHLGKVSSHAWWHLPRARTASGPTEGPEAPGGKQTCPRPSSGPARTLATCEVFSPPMTHSGTLK